MAFTTIPNELIIEIANYLPTRELSLLSSTSRALADLLTPYLLRHATNDDLFSSIILHRPASVRSLLCSPTVNANHSISVPDSNLPAWPLHHAARYSTPVIVAILIHHGVPVDEPERHDIPSRTSALQCAVLSGSPATVTLFLDAGANINRASDHTSSTPLGLACVNSFNDIANLLIDRGARISAHELISALFVGNDTLLKRMLDMGAPVDSLYTSRLTRQPITPLQYLSRLCRDGLCSTAVILLRKGADPNRGRKGHSSPLHCANRSGNARLARILMDYGAEAEAESKGMEMEYFRGIYHDCL